MLELIRGYWREVGIDLRINTVDRSLGSERILANEHEATVWEAGGDLLSAGYYFPQLTNCRYAPTWGQWYNSRGAEGEEPPDTELGNATKRQMELYDQIDVTIDAEEQTRLMQEIITIAREQFHSIGVTRELQGYFVKSNDFHNVPNPILRSFVYPTPGPTEPSQYFLAS